MCRASGHSDLGPWGFQSSNTQRDHWTPLSRCRAPLGSNSPTHPAYEAAGQPSIICQRKESTDSNIASLDVVRGTHRGRKWGGEGKQEAKENRNLHYNSMGAGLTKNNNHISVSCCHIYGTILHLILRENRTFL